MNHTSKRAGSDQRGSREPKSHNIEELAVATAPFHEALAGTLPRVEPADRRLFDLLRRAYIEARYSKSYHITLEELQILSHRVLELAQAVLVACHARLVKIGEGLPVGKLPEPPSADEAVDIPELPSLDDPKAVEAWRDALQRSAHARGERIGEEHGEARGREVGHHEGIIEERARAILDVLARRGIAVSDQQAARILSCRDESTLNDLWDRAWSVGSADALDG